MRRVGSPQSPAPRTRRAEQVQRRVAELRDHAGRDGRRFFVAQARSVASSLRVAAAGCGRTRRRPPPHGIACARAFRGRDRETRGRRLRPNPRRFGSPRALRVADGAGRSERARRGASPACARDRSRTCGRRSRTRKAGTTLSREARSPRVLPHRQRGAPGAGAILGVVRIRDGAPAKRGRDVLALTAFRVGARPEPRARRRYPSRAGEAAGCGPAQQRARRHLDAGPDGSTGLRPNGRLHRPRSGRWKHRRTRTGSDSSRLRPTRRPRRRARGRARIRHASGRQTPSFLASREEHTRWDTQQEQTLPSGGAILAPMPLHALNEQQHAIDAQGRRTSGRLRRSRLGGRGSRPQSDGSVRPILGRPPPRSKLGGLETAF